MHLCKTSGSLTDLGGAVLPDFTLSSGLLCGVYEDFKSAPGLSERERPVCMCVCVLVCMSCDGLFPGEHWDGIHLPT